MTAVRLLHEAARDTILIPGWVNDFESCRRWIARADVPEKLRAGWFGGELWIELAPEDLFTHVLVKTEIIAALGQLPEPAGLLLGCGACLSHQDAELMSKPDGLFVTDEAIAADRVRFHKDRTGGEDEIQGSPDLVLEVVSHSSVRKDMVALRQAYWEAGIREYWLVDARRPPIQFNILKHGRRG